MVAVLVAVLVLLFVIILSVEIYTRYGSRIWWALLVISLRQIYIRCLLQWNSFLKSLSFKRVGQCENYFVPGSNLTPVRCPTLVKDCRWCEYHRRYHGRNVANYKMVGRYEKGTRMYSLAATVELAQREKYRAAYCKVLDKPHKMWEDGLRAQSNNFFCVVDYRIFTIEEREEQLDLEAQERERVNAEARERDEEERYAEELRRYEEEQARALENPEENPEEVVIDMENWDDDSDNGPPARVSVDPWSCEELQYRNRDVIIDMDKWGEN